MRAKVKLLLHFFDECKQKLVKSGGGFSERRDFGVGDSGAINEKCVCVHLRACISERICPVVRMPAYVDTCECVFTHLCVCDVQCNGEKDRERERAYIVSKRRRKV